MLTKRHLLLALLPLSSTLLAEETEAGCAPIIQASQAKFSAPAFHDTMFESASAKTPSGEFIKLGEKAWMKADKGWMSIPTTLLSKMQNFDAAGFGMHNCKSLESGARTVYGWDLNVGGKVYAGSKLTVTETGLPMKTETSNGAYTLTTYSNVTAPSGAQ